MKLTNLIFALLLFFAPYVHSQKLKLKAEDIIKEYTDKGFSGSILLERRGKIIIKSGYGFAKREEKLKYQSETIFSTGSIAKQFTAAMIMQLYEQGKLALNTSISKYINYNIPEDKRKITIHHLLNHSSGLPDFFMGGDDFKKIDKRKALKKILNLKLLTNPGQKFSYSNSGYTLLAIIIEDVTNKSYIEYAKELFKNNGLIKSGFSGINNWDPSEVARGYGFKKKGDNTPNSWPAPSWMIMGNGEIMTNISDLHTWSKRLLADSVISKTNRTNMFTGYVKDERVKNTFYGYGWKIKTTDSGKNIIYHNGGGDFGQVATLRLYPDQNSTLIIMSNSYDKSPSLALQLARELEQKLLGI